MARILIVDDRSTNREYLATVLGYYGHTVDSASDGHEALAQAGYATPDLVITDLLMPNMDGEELARRLSTQPATAGVPVIFYTAAYFMHEARQIAERVGVKWVLPKPSEPADMMHVVGQALGAEQVAGTAPAARPRATAMPDTTHVYRSFSERLDRLMGGAAALASGQSKSGDVLDALQDVHGFGQQLTRLVRLGMEAPRERNPVLLADMFCEAAQDILNVRYVGVVMVDARTGRLRHFSAAGLSASVQAAVASGIASCAAAQHVMGDRQHMRLWVAARAGDEIGLPAPHPPVGNLLACAIIAREDANGWMYVAERLSGDRGFTPDDERLIRALAGQLGAAWESTQLHAELDRRVSERTLELETLNKELEAFSYTISHDLRAPLQAIRGFGGVLEQKFGHLLPPDGLRYLESVQRNAGRMERLIEELLRLSRISHQPLQGARQVRMRTLVQDCLDELLPQTEGRRIHIEVRQLPDAVGHPALLGQVWANLLGNAVKFTREQPQARIEVGCDEVDGEQVYYVKDNGAGFDMRYANSLFGVFRRLHSGGEFEGTGVGLATVQRIIRRHGGRIWALAAVGEGAAFYFTLGHLQADVEAPVRACPGGGGLG